MKNVFLGLLYGVVALVPHAMSAQRAIPLVDLPPASSRTAMTLGAVLGLRQGPDGKVLVNDALRRQMLLFDTTLTTRTVVMDSIPGTSTSYGPWPTPLIPYRGDSSIFADWNSRTVVVLDGSGRIARTFALPQPQDIIALNAASSGVDARGRLVFQGGRPESRAVAGRGSATGMDVLDSVPILRADLDARRVDTIAWIARPVIKVTTQKTAGGALTTIYVLDPLQAVDEWAVLSNGSVALVRGHDYHIDWMDADGSRRATAKLPFDWKRLTDGDKQKLGDSLRAAQDSLLAKGYPSVELMLRGPMPCAPPDQGRGLAPGAAGGARGGRGGSGGDAPPPPPSGGCYERVKWLAPVVGVSTFTRDVLPPLADLYRANPIADYVPPVRLNATVPDLDDHVWILPQTTTLSRRGELVYDVVNASGELFERVRLPLGRAIAGFGKGGVVYLTSGDVKNGYYLERARLPLNAK